jgi:hypothetical protein
LNILSSLVVLAAAVVLQMLMETAAVEPVGLELEPAFL